MAKNCDCIKRIEDKVLNHVKEQGKQAESASMQNLAFMFSSSETKTHQEIEVTINGKKKKEKINIIHTYCPFCGKEYTKED
jgi:hypothetical protein